MCGRRGAAGVDPSLVDRGGSAGEHHLIREGSDTPLKVITTAATSPTSPRHAPWFPVTRVTTVGTSDASRPGVGSCLSRLAHTRLHLLAKDEQADTMIVLRALSPEPRAHRSGLRATVGRRSGSRPACGPALLSPLLGAPATTATGSPELRPGAGARTRAACARRRLAADVNFGHASRARWNEQANTAPRAVAKPMGHLCSRCALHIPMISISKDSGNYRPSIGRDHPYLA